MSFRFVPTQRVTENSKKIAKNFKKLKNLVMASFQAKIGWKMLKKRENKNYRFVSFLPDGQQKIPKKQQKIFKKFKNTITASFQVKTGWKRLKKRENKNYRFVSFRSYPTGNRKFQKMRKKFKKIKKYHCGFISSKNRLEKVEKQRK